MLGLLQHHVLQAVRFVFFAARSSGARGLAAGAATASSPPEHQLLQAQHREQSRVHIQLEVS